MEEMYGLYHQSVSMAPPPARDYQVFQLPFHHRTDPAFRSANYDILSAAASSLAMSTSTGSEVEEMSSAIQAKIISHPLYPKLLHTYIDCQKVGAPPDIANLFDEIFQEKDVSRRSASSTDCLGDDPELNEFMESYCEVLMKYKSDLERPYNDATMFLHNIETQLSTLCNAGTSRISALVPVNLHSHASSVPSLNGTNFSEWRENVEFTLGVLDLDLALQTEKPSALAA